MACPCEIGSGSARTNAERLWRCSSCHSIQTLRVASRRRVLRSDLKIKIPMTTDVMLTTRAAPEIEYVSTSFVGSLAARTTAEAVLVPVMVRPSVSTPGITASPATLAEAQPVDKAKQFEVEQVAVCRFVCDQPSPVPIRCTR